MFKKYLRSIFFLLMIVTIGQLIFTQKGFAVGNSSITVSPALQQVSINANELSKAFTIEVSNTTNTTQAFSSSLVDFGTLDESGGVAFAGSSNSDLIKKYGLANWVTLTTPDFSVEPGKSIKLNLTINNSADLNPGGHYASLLITALSNVDSTDGQNIKIRQQLSSLIFVRKIGGERYDLKLSSVAHNGRIVNLPTVATLRFYNPGNVHVIPRGLVKVISPNGQVVSQGVINQDSDIVLPETYRKISVKLRTISSAGFAPGEYKLQVDYRYDGIDQFVSKTYRLNYISAQSVVTVLVITVTIYHLLKRELKKSKHRKTPKIVQKTFDFVRPQSKNIKK